MVVKNSPIAISNKPEVSLKTFSRSTDKPPSNLPGNYKKKNIELKSIMPKRVGSQNRLKTNKKVIIQSEDDSDPISKSLRLLRKIDIFLNVKNQGLKKINNINFEEYELKNEQK